MKIINRHKYVSVITAFLKKLKGKTFNIRFTDYYKLRNLGFGTFKFTNNAFKSISFYNKKDILGQDITGCSIIIDLSKIKFFTQSGSSFYLDIDTEFEIKLEEGHGYYHCKESDNTLTLFDKDTLIPELIDKNFVNLTFGIVDYLKSLVYYNFKKIKTI